MSGVYQSHRFAMGVRVLVIGCENIKVYVKGYSGQKSDDIMTEIRP